VRPRGAGSPRGGGRHGGPPRRPPGGSQEPRSRLSTLGPRGPSCPSASPGAPVEPAPAPLLQALERLAATARAAQGNPTPATLRAVDAATVAWVASRSVAATSTTQLRPETQALQELVDAIHEAAGSEEPLPFHVLEDWAERWPTYRASAGTPLGRDTFRAAVVAARAPPYARATRRWELACDAARAVGLQPPAPESLERTYRRHRR